jgi:hypothetical protein
MIGKSPGPCNKFSTVLPVLLTRIDGYKIFTDQFFKLRFDRSESNFPILGDEPQAVPFVLQVWTLSEHEQNPAT